MITIKIPYTANERFYEKLKELRREYSLIVRYAFNRYQEKMKQINIRHSLKELRGIENANSWLQQCAIMEANQLHSRFKEKKIVFGGKKNFIERMKGKMTKEELKEKRLLPLNIQGEANYHGNRMCNLHLLNDSMIEFKVNRKEHYFLKLPNLRNNYKKVLEKLEMLNENDGYTYSVRLTEKELYISFEEFKDGENLNLKNERYLGIDLNPDNIGVSILEDGNIIHTQEYSLQPIFDKILNSDLSSNSSKMKYFQDKLQFETIQISKSISILAKHFQCKNVFIEDLKFKMKLSLNQKYNHLGNRKNRNLWKRELFVSNLNKRLNIFQINLHSVNPAYSSFIGNLQYDFTDSVNASIEIARRGYEWKVKKNKNGFYPVFSPKSSIQHQWKEMGIEWVEDWKKLFTLVKNLKFKYRVSLEEAIQEHLVSVFRLNQSKKSYIDLYSFI